ncbi:class I SAM-dependent methyltransferase [Planctomycetes bacterium K23_9]|uniref:Ubiquinone biosynthesis O-methyltransferase n=1 Tax=Stieleria marina TaxID=1930275 RepID=A0A517NYR1_9BACT|nr:Ubiquinone biosynthesis O-methyltransferase [Planctomycetes bacterium K23_9]
MIEYSRSPESSQKIHDKEVAVFSLGENLDPRTVESFGEEWEHFSEFDEKDLGVIGPMYFSILLPYLNKEVNLLDAGCGTGRWSKYLSTKVGWIEAIDPSSAVQAAGKLLEDSPNVRITRAGIGDIPFEDETFDVVISVGVLHHMPDTFEGIARCAEKLKPGGRLFVYLYYSCDNRGTLFRLCFKASNVLRRVVAALPSVLKQIVCDILAVTVYLPLVALARVIRWFSPKSEMFRLIPLSAYYDKSFWVIRNDSRDRFGTPLEQRFSKVEIEAMLTKAGLTNVEFSDHVPFWCAVAMKPTGS